MKLLFHSNHLGLLGTEVAMFDYAQHAQSLLGHRAEILFDRSNPNNDPLIVEKFARHFPLHPYGDFSEVEGIAESARADRVYFIKSGVPDGKLTKNIPSLVHAVYPIEVHDFHGSVFAFVSEWLSQKVTNGGCPFVPHMVNLPSHNDDLRSTLNIPKDSLVIGSYGAPDSFDVPFVPPAIQSVLQRRKDIFFLFMNYPRVIVHERAIYLPRAADPDFKVRFINTSDAMLHARMYGETFGLACAEFSSRNKPVLTFGASPLRSHLELLGERAIVYNNGAYLVDMLLNLNKSFIATKAWDCYSERFSPASVMQKFKQVFLDPAI